MKTALKSVLQALALALVWAPALTSGFGRWEAIYLFWAQSYALLPGLVGDYLRTAYYQLTLEDCGPGNRIQFGSFFAHPQARLGHNVYIGCYCVLGRTRIGDRTQIGSGVQILSGARQHSRDAAGHIQGSHTGTFLTVEIGADCWIGAGAILMADVGAGSTIGAGAVVTKPVPPRSVAFGVPARVKES